ncbi:MAG TPA: hypothetical protein VHD83_20415 [Puia sp.]|nr:hypothetical protein [Puia sp.]
MSVVICKLPRAGLGNQLFPLLKAAVFARLNELPLIVTGYNQFKIGPYLRGEKIKRNYRGYFLFEKGLLGEQVDQFRIWRSRGDEDRVEPTVEVLPAAAREGKRFIFSEIPHWSDHFAGLREHRQLTLEIFEEMVCEGIKRKAEVIDAPCIGVHIRMGDFRKLKEGEDFQSVGAVRTPEEYFMQIIRQIREIAGIALPVSVFTDGRRHELETLFTMENISMVEGNPDLVDMLALSRSGIIVASANSTFSYWAGFLSKAPLILHPDHIHAPIRYGKGEGVYEGPFDVMDDDMVSGIKNIKEGGDVITNSNEKYENSHK